MNRSTITAAALAGFALALAAGYLLAQDRTADSWDPDPEHGRFQIIHAAPAGTFLLNTRNGDSWRWYYTPASGNKPASGGWQFSDRPTRFDECTMTPLDKAAGRADPWQKLCQQEPRQRFRERGLTVPPKP